MKVLVDFHRDLVFGHINPALQKPLERVNNIEHREFDAR